MNYIRLKTKEVSIGDLKLGAHHPIRVQSMTTANTLDTKAVVQECIRLANVGCELIRITTPSIKEVENLIIIKKELKEQGYTPPLCADIHYTPNAAELAARIVEKVRINPGNYADKKKFQYKEYSDAEYQAELERIRKKFLPLVRVCKEYGTALRIGTNHGSLSDRILSRYGDTPQGMVESAMEFVRICQEENFHNIVISMKASNPIVMIEAYRLLVSTMIQNQHIYPIHLGVTEAGDGEDARIKSAIGIGTLLEDGIGDTVRVSLTEAPEYEIPVAKKLVEPYNQFLQQHAHDIDKYLLTYHPKWNKESITPINQHKNKSTLQIKNIGQKQIPIVIHSLQQNTNHTIKPTQLFSAGYIYKPTTDKWNLTDLAADYVYIGKQSSDLELPGNLGLIQDYEVWKNHPKPQHYPLIPYSSLSSLTTFHPELNFIYLNTHEINTFQYSAPYPIALILHLPNEFFTAGKLLPSLQEFYSQYHYPIIFHIQTHTNDEELFILESSKILGYLFTAGFGNGIMIEKNHEHPYLSPQKLNLLMFNILQGLRERISKTEYIACPSCGRTLFDLQKTTKKIKEKTAHLKGLKIGIMGCIVNGPGEMADADFGYVGTGPGKVSLYKGHELIKRNIPEEKAVDELINLIKEYGMYKEHEPLQNE